MEQQRLIAANIILVLAASSLFAITIAQSSSSCTNVLISLSPCLNYIQGNSSSPSSGCCKQLTTVVQSQPQCLCQVLNGGGSSFGISVNQTQAMALPSACGLQTSSISKCSSAATPSGSKTPSSSTSGSSSNTTPSTSDGSSNGSTTKLSFSLLLSLLFVASYASAVNSV